jgi:hypothetical protein
MEEVILSVHVNQKLKDLVNILIQKEYFGFQEDAQIYVDKIYDYIYTIPSLPHRKTKKPKHGAYYVVYRVKNKRTQYYITFDKKANQYIIENIFTSHEKGYATYIRGIK